MSEIKDIMDYLGKKLTEGDVRGQHLGLILMYFHRTKTEKLNSSLSKLALICGMAKRQIKENYVDGLIEFGVIETRVNGHEVIWNWVGAKAFEDVEEPFLDFVKHKKKEKEEKEKKG